jgi:signal transduction histidine kinase/CheY-like chemotaxis protein
MRGASIYLVLFLTALLTTWSVMADPVDVHSLEQPVSLAGQWQFNPGDDVAWAAPAFNASEWQLVTVPASSPAGYPGYSGMAWYRLTVQLDLQQADSREQLNRVAVMLGAVESAYEFYAGGQLLGGIGQLPPQASERYDQHAVYQIPSTAISPDGQLVLAMRVWRSEDAGSSGSSGPYEGAFLIGDDADLSSLAVERSLMPGMLMATLYLSIGLYHLFIATRNPVMREFFWFGWFAVALSLYSMETTQWRYNIELPFLWHLKLEYVTLFLLPFLAIEVTTRSAKIPLNFVLRSFKTIFLLFAVVVAIIPTIRIHYLTLPYFQYLAATWAVYTAGLMGWHAFNGNRNAAALSTLLLVLVVSLLNDLFLNGALLGTADTLYIVLGMTVLLMAVLMANHYTATLAKLEHSVEERTVDLLQSNQQLQDANAIKEQFLANMSHELRTPMSAIIGLTHLGLQTELSEQQRDYLSKVDASAANLLGIIDSVLDFSKLQAGELRSVNESFDLRSLLDELAVVSSEQVAEREGLRVGFNVDSQIPAALSGDSSKLATVLRNLIGNAIKFTPAGIITVDAAVEENDSKKVRIKFSVADTGIGISQEQREQLFEGFSQADNSFSRAFGGTGLGLATAKALTQLMGGEISVTSREGHGSCFNFTLDFSLLGINQQAVGLPAGDNKRVSHDLSPIQGAAILVVDDSEINLQIASEILQQAGFRVDVAHDGKQAVDMVRQKTYDCVLMDLQMPVMDGFMAAETIRADAEFKDLPILAVTANFSSEDRAHASRAGMNAHIPKPLDPQQLFGHLLEWVAPGEREAVKNAATDTEEPDQSLPAELPGLRVEEGLVRVGGNSRLYLKLLEELGREYLGTAEKITQLLLNNEVEPAKQLAHKLRGIANNLGAINVGRISGEIENYLNEKPELPETVLPELAASLSVLGQSINSMLANSSSSNSSASLGKATVSALLDKLAQEIAQSNPAATETSESLLAGMAEGAEGKTELEAVVLALDVFDFASAEQHVKAFRQKGQWD